MKIEIYAMTVLKPVNFPSEVEIQVVPLSSETNSPLGGHFSMTEHRSWEWIKSHYPIRFDYFQEIEEYLKAGDLANLVKGSTIVELPDDVKMPERAEFRVIGD